ncbi:MAG: flagellar M-ring protein FliF [Oscillospiraceae bacterium]|jgi:flagellar M-ring protein FliF|nr:flagellar M-ring protein FliF [Oscillospiraceae bacterium]
MDKARAGLKKFGVTVKEKWSGANKNTRIITLAVAASMIAALIVLIALSGRADFEVLYAGVSAEEISEITSALSTLGIQARIDGSTVSVPRDTVDSARMQLAIQGFPKSTYNYNIWNEGVGMFSTDAERQEIQRQQLEQNIRATLRSLTPIQDALVTVHPAEQRPYVMSVDRLPARASVMLTIHQGVRLNSAQIEGIYHLVQMSVPELRRENLTVANQDGITLIADDANNAEANLALEMQRMNMQFEFQRTMENRLRSSVEDLLAGTVRDFRVAVNVRLNFSEWESQSREYEGANIDEIGFQHGIVDFEERLVAWNAIDAEGGLVGMTVDADISPGSPTWVGGEGSEAYFERSERTQYLVNQYDTFARSNGFDIDMINVAVQIDEGALTQDQIDEYRMLLANTVGTEMAYVSVRPTNFLLEAPLQITGPPQGSPVRNMLIFIIISLGALLIILFMLAIMSSGSKKRRLIRAKATAYQGAGATPAFDDIGMGYNTFEAPQDEEREEIKLQSLLGEGEGQTRDALLKNEIREFAKTNPDIVAQLIRTWIREG